MSTCTSTTSTFNCGDFNMSAFSTVGDVFSDPKFSAPGNSLLWGLGAPGNPNRGCAGFLITPKRPYEWRADAHGCYKYDNAALGFGPRDQTALLPVFLHLRTTNLPRPDSIMRSEHAQQRRIARKATRPERRKRDDVDDRDVVYHDHASASFPTPSTVTSESLARIWFPLH